LGIFQAVSDHLWDETNDFDLWLCLLRECAEELLGEDEYQPRPDQPIDYATWAFAARMTTACEAGDIRVHCLGMGVDPLTFATDVLVTLVIQAHIYDELFAGTVTTNAEGRLLTEADGLDPSGRAAFTAEAVGHYSGDVPMQAAGAALLRLAWRHRNTLLW
jgi:hypothetical protein